MAGLNGNGKGKAVCGGLSALFMPSSSHKEKESKPVRGGLSALFMSSTSHEEKESKPVRGGLSALFMSPSSDHEEKEEEEFQEGDMWDQPKITRNPTVVMDYSTSVPKLIVPIPPSKREENLPKRPSTRPDEDSRGIDFPDWDKILGEEAPGRKQFWWDDGVEYEAKDVKNENKFSERMIYRPHGAKGDEDDEEYDHLAPHEIVSKRYYKNRAAYSMCEGAGRTLKGRDLRKFRNTVLFLTGYIETM